MPTTTVKKGAGRPAATARSNRHAQRTPLPPKQDVVLEARELIATVTPPQYGYMSQAELYARALELKIGRRDRTGRFTPIAKSTPKGKLLTAILAAEQAASRAEAKVDAALKPSKLDAKLDAAFSPAEVKEAHKWLDGKSGAKAEDFITRAMDLGWKADATLHQGDAVTVIVTRGEEQITISWTGGVFQDNCTYAHNGRTPIKLRNASAAKQRMAVEPARANEEATRVTAHKAVKAAARKAPSAQRRLPFTDASLDQEVLDSVYGKRITWTNSISQQEEEERVPALAEGTRLPDGSRGTKKQHHAPRITEGPRGRVLEFVGASGFRAVALSQITRVR